MLSSPSGAGAVAIHRLAARPRAAGPPIGRLLPSRRAAAAWAVGFALAGLLSAADLPAQSTGQILGRVTEESTGEPVAAAEVTLEGLDLGVLTSERGDFILDGVPTGTHRLRVERIGFRTMVVVVRVRPGRTTQLTVQIPPSPVEVEGVAAEVERVRLIEPEVTATHELVIGRELRELPLDEVEEAVELATGVSDGHFRGGRVGQEVYRIDGLEVKNQVDAATQGAAALELSPTALEEIDVKTGGFGADNGAALSGVVSYATRRGSTQRWEGRASLLGDHWAPDALSGGFTSFSTSAGGPLRFLGPSATLFVDLLAQGMIDADRRARGLTCLEPGDTDDAQLAAAIEGLRSSLSASHLYCPFATERLPHQRGDKLIGFLRLDRPLTGSLNLTLSLLYNRRQQELYTPEFKYNELYQLGQRTKGYLGTLTLDWARAAAGRAYQGVLRLSAMRLDRYLGTVDPWTFEERGGVAGFGFGDFRFLGEDFARSAIEEQLVSASPLPGHVRPGGVTGSPFGPAAEGIFFTAGTPDLASWNRSDFLGVDATGEVLSAQGHAVRAGVQSRFYRVESYERTRAYLAGSLPNYARYYPTTVAGFGEVSLLAAHGVTVDLGVRLEAFRSGISFQADRTDFRAPTVDPKWRTEFMPRLGMAVPIPGTEERTMFRFNYGLVAQPPDFRFFLDTTLGDSLRSDIRRQGNPNLAFERGTAWEVSVSHLVTDQVSVGVTGYYKDLHNLVTSALTFEGFADNQFTTGDFGTVRGLEVAARARLTGFHAKVGYALQSAKGVTSSAFEDPGAGLQERRIEFPLAFDGRHAADLTLLWGRGAGAPERRWGLALTASARSGFPVNRAVIDVDSLLAPEVERLPWTVLVDLRMTRHFSGLPGCARCGWRIILDGRNILGRENIIALRRDTGTLAPSLEQLEEVAAGVPDNVRPIPFESPGYSADVDLDGSGFITAEELRTARFAAALDRNDPSLFFGSASSLRVGLEVSF